MENLRDLLERNDFLEFRDGNDNSFLHIVLNETGIELDLVKLLLEKGLDVNAKNKFGYSPLQYAVSNPDCNVDIIKLLLDRGASINHQDDCGNSVLHHVLRQSNCAVIKLLIDKGADVNAVNNDGDPPLHHAVNNSKWGVFNQLSNHENDNNEGNFMARKLDILKLLLDRGPDLEFKNNYGDSPLHYAVNHCNQKRDLISLLLRKGAKLNLTNNCGESSLHRAIYSCGGNCEIIKLLLDYGADINLKNNCGDYPLCLAVNNPACMQDTLKLLLDRGANVLACNKSGDLPLQKAIQDYEEDETTVGRVQLLIKYTLATSLGFNLNTIIKPTKHYQSLLKFATQCMLELISMGSEKVARMKYPQIQQPIVVTLYEFMCGYQVIPWFPPDKEGRTFRGMRSVFQTNIHEILGVLQSKKFPLYNELISSKVKRKDMIDTLAKQVVFTSRGDDTIILDFYSVCGIAQYLSNSDLLNWIMSYHGMRPSFFVILGNPLCKKLLGKRGAQEIEQCVKRYKKSEQDINVSLNSDEEPKIIE